VQNEFHPADRRAQPVLDECARRKIAFVPFASLGFGAVGPDSILDAPEVRGVAARLGCTPAQVALAWALDSSPNLLVIPGTSSRPHLRENLSAAEVRLDAEAVHQLSLMWEY
jgi:aryl-alcohol dehydrogenase-like predicted oxidoreductase